MKPIACCRTYLFSVLFMAVFIVQAAGVPTPTVLTGGSIVTVQEARGFMAAGAGVIDVRSAINFGRGHIPGAVLVPYKGSSAKQVDADLSLDDFSISLLPEDRNADVLIYSHGETGWKSYKAAVTAVRSGYTRVHWLREGFAAWKAAGLPVAR